MVSSLLTKPLDGGILSKLWINRFIGFYGACDIARNAATNLNQSHPLYLHLSSLFEAVSSPEKPKYQSVCIVDRGVPSEEERAAIRAYGLKDSDKGAAAQLIEDIASDMGTFEPIELDLHIPLFAGKNLPCTQNEASLVKALLAATALEKLELSKKAAIGEYLREPGLRSRAAAEHKHALYLRLEKAVKDGGLVDIIDKTADELHFALFFLRGRIDPKILKSSKAQHRNINISPNDMKSIGVEMTQRLIFSRDISSSALALDTFKRLKDILLIARKSLTDEEAPAWWDKPRLWEKENQSIIIGYLQKAQDLLARRAMAEQQATHNKHSPPGRD